MELNVSKFYPLVAKWETYYYLPSLPYRPVNICVPQLNYYIWKHLADQHNSAMCDIVIHCCCCC